jgi:hypothetical protein
MLRLNMYPEIFQSLLRYNYPVSGVPTTYILKFKKHYEKVAFFLSLKISLVCTMYNKLIYFSFTYCQITNEIL